MRGYGGCSSNNNNNDTFSLPPSLSLLYLVLIMCVPKNTGRHTYVSKVFGADEGTSRSIPFFVYIVEAIILVVSITAVGAVATSLAGDPTSQ
ncbi:hypothetical protein BDB00DRAFT_934394 [Zychaea mexicana]|uniref:uncharacterized protein n=1 Tax=Zychaea mexicana TaxID=64656 RepID=UPI0022FEBA30|nr:uncharacterized protein BDB00DRAFT_934394 [Zychaea mexicana]KAI9470464.1 hypothetical protein BDB00DRAFT_934394 [Zychaea mexicana]